MIKFRYKRKEIQQTNSGSNKENNNSAKCTPPPPTLTSQPSSVNINNNNNNCNNNKNITKFTSSPTIIPSSSPSLASQCSVIKNGRNTDGVSISSTQHNNNSTKFINNQQLITANIESNETVKSCINAVVVSIKFFSARVSSTLNVTHDLHIFLFLWLLHNFKILSH